MTPLSYLWQRDQRELLAEMIDAGMDAILIKVAGIGLSAKHLGKSLADMQPTLLKLVRYGPTACNVLSYLLYRMTNTVRISAVKAVNTKL